MTSPSQLGALEDGIDALHFSPAEDLCVWDLVMPLDVEQSPKASHVEAIELFCMAAIHSPGLTCIQQGWKDKSTVDFKLSL